MARKQPQRRPERPKFAYLTMKISSARFTRAFVRAAYFTAVLVLSTTFFAVVSHLMTDFLYYFSSSYLQIANVD